MTSRYKQYPDAIELVANGNKQINEFNRIMSRKNITKKDKELFNDGYYQGLNGRTLEEVADKLELIPFKNGYELGVRQKEIAIFQQKIKIVEDMVKENIPFEMAPDDIKSNDNLRKHYILSACKEKVATKGLKSNKQFKK